jgi:hypothetical protein
MTQFDRRQAILTELDTLLAALVPTITLTGTNGTPAKFAANGYVHNRNELPQGLVPGVILLDGDETVGLVPVIPGRIPPRIAPQIMKVTPEIYVVLDVRKPNNINVGADLSIARLAIIKSIWSDAYLLDLVSSNGRIVCEASVTDLARNRMMQGQLGISISFYYPLIPNEVVGY